MAGRHRIDEIVGATVKMLWGSLGVAHYGSEVPRFVTDYFGDSSRRCLLIAAAGFDPRSAAVAQVLAAVLRRPAEGRYH